MVGFGVCESTLPKEKVHNNPSQGGRERGTTIRQGMAFAEDNNMVMPYRGGGHGTAVMPYRGGGYVIQ